MWILKFTFILLGVIYELLHYVFTGIYNVVSKKIAGYLFKLNKGNV